MEKRNNILLISLIVMVIINAVTISSIWLRPGREIKEDIRVEKVIVGEPPPPGDKLAELVGFRKEQMEKFDLLKREHHRDAEKLLIEMRKEKQELMQMVSKEPSNSEKVIGAAEEIGRKQKELELITFNHFKAIRELCEGEQKQKFDTVIIDLKDVIRIKPLMNHGE